MKAIHRILVEPLLTEKSTALMMPEAGARKYTFKVAMSANKYEIRQAVEERFEVKVTDIKTLICRGKNRRVRGQAGKTANWKKAVVRLQDGQSISEFEGA